MSKFDNYLRYVGIFAHILLVIYLLSNYQYYVYGFIAFILGIIGYIYLNLKEHYVSLKNLFFTLYIGIGILVCSLLISFPIVMLCYEVFEYSKKYNSLIFKILLVLLVGISILFNYWFHKNRKD